MRTNTFECCHSILNVCTFWQVCVVTGAARGLGNLIARTLVESGANALAIIDLDGPTSEAAAKDVVDWFIEHGEAAKGEVHAIGLGCDVSNEDQVKATIAKIADHFGRIDVLVTAAGIVHNYPATEWVHYNWPDSIMLISLNIDTLQKRCVNSMVLTSMAPCKCRSLPLSLFTRLWLIAASFSLTSFCARETAKVMLGQNAPGTIILVGSMSGSVVNVPQAQTPYNLSKAAVRHMASSLAVEWAKKKIRVNCIARELLTVTFHLSFVHSLSPVSRLHGHFIDSNYSR